MSKTQAPTPHDSFRPVLGAAVGLFIVLLAIASLKSYRDLDAARGREHLLETRIEETQSRIDHLRVRIDRLRADPGMLERLAREDLGMVRPGDVIIELPLEGAAAGPPRRAPVVPPPPQAAPSAPPAVPAGNPVSIVPAPVVPVQATPAAGSAGSPAAPRPVPSTSTPPPASPPVPG